MHYLSMAQAPPQASQIKWSPNYGPQAGDAAHPAKSSGKLGINRNERSFNIRIAGPMSEQKIQLYRLAAYVIE
jgi:hypothetical protein